MFVPDDFIVPEIYTTEEFTIRKLTPLDAHEDYKAVMDAREHIHELYGDFTLGWPETTLTVERDKEDLVRHEAEFDNREAFAYTVF